jgi:uncharacterized protein (DUF2249 family)
MSMLAPLTLDVRPELRSGAEPLPKILQAVGRLQAGQSLRLLTTFEPIPLYAVLGWKGFAHVATHHGEGEWEILFTPGNQPEERGDEEPVPVSRRVASTTEWPPSTNFLDNRGFQPPEPMIRILVALEHLAPGEVLEVINDREPMFLYPELQVRGTAIQVRKQDDGTVRLLIRRGH